ncbi:MAG: hypothetical protein LUQ22_06425 [Methanotrichaceae archaeon]|nr:hypothetical protein [Methanotrichaceae archaeon]
MPEENESGEGGQTTIEDPSGNPLPCIPWTGYEKDLPAGGILPAGIMITDLVRWYVILDAESEEGVKLEKPKDVTKDSKLINAIMNEGSIRALGGSGSKRILIADPDGGRKLTRLEWYNAHHNDGLALWAVRNKRAALNRRAARKEKVVVVKR